ncbi:MAG: hypothetical protein KIT07_05985 [Anaerolineales bacterium]|nr:hypothetical protein [Anaerolineales bacterium]
MPSALAFFPWVHVEEPLEFGPVRLLPYQSRPALPGDLPHVRQADIKGVLAAYADRPNKPIRRAALLEFGDWQSGMDISDEIVTQLFRARNFIAVAALSQRSLFHQNFGYCNYHQYALVVQRYGAGQTGTFAFTTRRRDGGTQQLWGSDEFAFHRPNHAVGNQRITLDGQLLRALAQLPTSHEHLYEALVEFCSANTDSDDVPLHVELVMCKSAFEWLLGIKPEAKAFVDALRSRIVGITPCDPAKGPMLEKWEKQWQHETRPLFAWAKEFCASRGVSAHGQARKTFVWKAHQHLAFAALLFPLLLKKVLADDRLFELSEYDIEQLRYLDHYLAHDPFDHDRLSDVTHPWVEITSHARMRIHAKQLYS